MHRLAAIAALAMMAGCATLTDSNVQQVRVQTILENREVSGVGCVLFNDVGRWFVTSPGSVSIRKSNQPLRVDCRQEGASWAYEKVDSKLNATVWGNVLLTAGAGYLVDRNTGAGYDYPDTLTVLLHRQEAAATALPVPAAGLTVY